MRRNFYLVLVFFSLFLANLSYSQGFSTNLINSVVESIYKIEGGAKTKYPFGIKSIDTGGNYEKSRRICYNTVNNNINRFINQSKYHNYFDFLADRYCPPSADKQGNINWKKNIKSILGQSFIQKFHKEIDRVKKKR